jgi:hypothetical protein
MVKAVLDELKKPEPKNHFTIGIMDDVTHTSLTYDPEFSTEDPRTVRALFYGLGSDGTVGANKNSIKIIGKGTDNYAQGYFVYDSKKAGAVTASHVRFGPDPIRSTYLISKASFIACHQFQFLDRMDVECTLRSRRNLEPHSSAGSGNHHQKEAALFRDRRLLCGAPGGHGQPRQHHHAGVFLCHQRRSTARASDCRD